jgi:ABC-type antimicrobial peptide transport system permease subunit
VLVLSSSLLGVLIGTVVAFTMTLQQSLFTQLPVPFDFPYTILFVVFGCSILFSVLAAFSPIRSVLNQRIVQIFRILN